MKVLLLTPPMVQVNTPYPATAYLTGFLRTHARERGVIAVQDDPALALVLRLLSRDGLASVRLELERRRRGARRGAGPRAKVSHGAAPEEPRAVTFFLEEADRYLATVDAVVRFLQGGDPSLALRIAGRAFLPEGPRFAALREGVAPEAHDDDDDAGNQTLAWAFGALGLIDRAKYLASLYVDDLADVVREGVDPRFELSRYGDSLAASAPTFDALREALDGPPTLIDGWLDEIATELTHRHAPDLVALTVPFPGNVYGAFRIARAVKRARPEAVVAMGGGYVNTELRGLSDPRVFDDVDYVTLDDGETPLLALIDHLRAGRDPRAPLLRTMLREEGRVVTHSDPSLHDVPHGKTGTPTYDGLPLPLYLSLVEMLNPMHRLWSDGRWNKLTVAHGCYWKKCTFCDVTLDYIGRYDPISADLLVDRIVALVAETGQTGFHFVDEAAPPAALRALAERLIARNVTITWWGNIRFEKTFTPALAALLARSGCVAVSGGLEVASDRLLALMKKGVTVAQVARLVATRFTDAGVAGCTPTSCTAFRPRPSRRPSTRSSACASCSRRVASSPRSGTASLRRPGARSACAPTCTASACARRRRRRSRGTSSPSRIPWAAITSGSAAGCARRSTTTCTASGSTPTSARGSPCPSRPDAGATRRRAARTPRVTAADVPPDLIRAALEARGA